MKQKDSLDIVVGNQIRRVRISKGITQVELGKRVDVSFQQIQKYETATNRISIGMLGKISVALGVTLESLVTETLHTATNLKPIEIDELPLDTAKLLKAYQQIRQPLLRKRLLKLAYAMAETK